MDAGRIAAKLTVASSGPRLNGMDAVQSYPGMRHQDQTECVGVSKIIFLNGCGSSGKTSIARSIQYLSNDLWLTFGVDTFISMTPFPSDDKGEAGYFSFIPGKNDRGPTMHVKVGPKGDQLFGIMPDFSNLLANRGNNLIIDEVLFDDQIDRVHSGSFREYDLKVDTSTKSPFNVAKQILSFVDDTVEPKAFVDMRKKLNVENSHGH